MTIELLLEIPKNMVNMMQTCKANESKYASLCEQLYNMLQYAPKNVY